MGGNGCGISFYSKDEESIIADFSSQGYLILPLLELEKLNEIRDRVCCWAGKNGKSISNNDFLNQYHLNYDADNLNCSRLSIIEKMRQDEIFRSEIYQLGKKYLDSIVGNELSMQTACNLSVQIPNDESSLLPIHADIWSGNSPYEVVFWLPLVDCYRTKSMYILDLDNTQKIYDNFPQYSSLNADEFYHAISDKVTFIDVAYGNAIIFWNGLLHGNRVNVERETRWSINVRFKSLLTPYGSKELGESFLPITTRPLTRIGFSYKKPKI